jgi:protein-S-isoprenylcysteine O-methyltransferase Ste14
MLLFAGQYSLLAVLLFSGKILPDIWYLLLPLIAGVLLGLWSIASMGIRNLNAGPDVLPSATLVSSGPYKMIRHPMYLAIILAIIPMVIDDFTPLRLLLLILLGTILILKIRYEESMLGRQFPDYSHYASGTWRLIPFVY